MITFEQRELCKKHGARPHDASDNLKIGIAANVRSGMIPVNGLRHPPHADTTGWYIWAGEELSSAPDFFMPLHLRHLEEWRPEVLKYLALPPGWRFLVAPDYEDVWYDPALLLTEEGLNE